MMAKIKICGLKSFEDVNIVNEVIPEYVGFVFAESKRKVSKELAIHMREVLNPEIQVVGVFVKEPMEHIIELCREGVIDCVQLHGEEELGYVIDLKKQIQQPIIYAKRIGQPRVVSESAAGTSAGTSAETASRIAAGTSAGTESGTAARASSVTETRIAVRVSLGTSPGLASREEVQAVNISNEARIYDETEVATHLEQFPVDFLLFDTYVKDVYGGSGKLIDYEGISKPPKPIFLAGGLTAEMVGVAIRSVRPYCVDVSSGVETNGRKDREKVLRFVEQVRNEDRYKVLPSK